MSFNHSRDAALKNKTSKKNNMKTSMVLCLIILIECNNETNAQSRYLVPGGLYETVYDFQQQKLTYEIDCNSGKDKIKADEFFGSPTGYIVSKGEKHIFNKNKVYGYRTCQNKTYRFYNGKAYELIDTSGFSIYYKYQPEEVVKGKGCIKKDEYFFSKTPWDNLQLLTVDNLKNTFSDDPKFYYVIETNFKSDEDLIAYDKFRKSYKIKYLYSRSLN